MIRWAGTAKIKTFFSNELKDAVGSYSAYDELKENLPASFNKCDHLSKAQYLEMSTFLSSYLLSSQGDRMAMAHSLEIRLPYLDYRIIEYMAKVPSKWKILGLNEKYILKKIMKDILPESIVTRPKQPYRAPIARALLASNIAYINEILSEGSLRQAGLFDAAKVKKLLAKLRNSNQAGEVDNMALAAIVSSQTLYDWFITNRPAKPAKIPKIDLIVDCRNENKT